MLCWDVVGIPVIRFWLGTWESKTEVTFTVLQDLSILNNFICVFTLGGCISFVSLLAKK